MPSERLIAGDDIPPGSGVIEVHVRDLSQLFNSMDPSPFLEKDLDVDAEEFIVSWAKELPDDAPLAVLIHLDRPAVVPEEGHVVGDAVHSFFRHRAEMAQQRLRQLLRRGRTSLFIGLPFLAGCILLGDWVAHVLAERPSAQVIRESLLVGGWVAMWRPMEVFLYDWWPIRRERRVYDRLAASAVRIACTGNPNPAPARMRESPAAASVG
jgi:hypothetical protein